MKKFLIKVNGTPYEVEVEEVKENVPVQPAAETVNTVAPTPAPAPAVEKKAFTPAGAVEVTAPMPGTVLKVNVSEGDMVKKGQALLILEAMKMENEISAPADGKVVAVHVAKGKSVNVGDVMVVLG
ncbi:MAG: biotin/lipoyl-binding protein [Clostridiales bacterium]|nr:biotin/lipoyl-binding protein [Eubacteriales bacterium]MDH7565361.1 biotin/lipoyl-binding protein [Clostridiales bacterium]